MTSRSSSLSLSPTGQRIVLYLSLTFIAVYVYGQKVEGERNERAIREIYDKRAQAKATINRAIETFRNKVGGR